MARNVNVSDLAIESASSFFGFLIWYQFSSRNFFFSFLQFQVVHFIIFQVSLKDVVRRG